MPIVHACSSAITAVVGSRGGSVNIAHLPAGWPARTGMIRAATSAMSVVIGLVGANESIARAIAQIRQKLGETINAEAGTLTRHGSTDASLNSSTIRPG